MSAFFFTGGRRYRGAGNVPWFAKSLVSMDKVSSYLAKEGFTDVHVTDQAGVLPPDWPATHRSEGIFAMGLYSGADGTKNLPSGVTFVEEIPAPVVLPPPPPPAPPAPGAPTTPVSVPGVPLQVPPGVVDGVPLLTDGGTTGGQVDAPVSQGDSVGKWVAAAVGALGAWHLVKWAKGKR